jgi:putative ABC transport system ATP-binding protein
LPASSKDGKAKKKAAAASKSGRSKTKASNTSNKSPSKTVDSRWAEQPPEKRLAEGPVIERGTEAREAPWVKEMERDRPPVVATSWRPRLSGGAAMVEAKGVSKIYNSGPSQVVALNSVTLTLNQGEMVAVMGPSGSGKTTLLNCLSGLDEVSSGEVIIEGVSLARMSDAARTEYRARRMGFVFQAFNLLPVFSSVENVELPLLLSGLKASKARQTAREALNSVGLSSRERHRPSELSAGEQQRVAIARAIAPDPAVLWADEPTGNLDTENAQRVIQMIKRLNVERGLTILLVTHDHQMAGWAEQMLQMRDGRVIG